MPFKFAQRQVEDPRAQENFEQLSRLLPVAVTALPTTPADGQEIHYAADAVNGVVWHLRYNAKSTSAYKWELVGGPPLVNQSQARVVKIAMAAATYGGVDGSDPTLTLARAGDYLVQHGCYMQPVTAAAIVGIGVKIGATEPVSNTNDTQGQAAGANQEENLSQTILLTGVAAGAVITQRYYQNQAAQDVRVGARLLTALPVRLS